jgi:hypothetical protein
MKHVEVGLISTATVRISRGVRAMVMAVLAAVARR